MSRTRRRTAALTVVTALLLAATAYLHHQIEDQRYATTAFWHLTEGWILVGLAALLLAGSAVAAGAVGGSGLPPAALLALWAAAVAVAWEAGPMWLRSGCFASAALVPLAALRWSEQISGWRVAPRLWRVGVAVSAASCFLALLLYQPLRDAGCVAVCGSNPWAVAHVGPAAQLPVVGAVVVALVLSVPLLRGVLGAGGGVALPATSVLVAVVASVTVPLASRPDAEPSLAIWTVSAASLIGLSVVAAVVLLEAARRRRRLASLVTALSTAPQREDLEAALATILGGAVSVRYADPIDAGAAQRSGGLAEDEVEIRSRGAVAAWLTGPGVRRALRVGELRTLDPAAALLVDNAAIVVGLRRQIDLARAARSAVVVASDDARLRLERDLHDGSQQLVLALAMDLRLLAEACPSGSLENLGALAARDEVAAALDELRSVAHGMHPAALEHGGLRGALDMLEEMTGVRIGVEGSADVDPEMLMAVYRLVESVVDQSCGEPSPAVSVEVRQTTTSVEIVVDPGSATPTVDVEGDRLAALGATLDPGPPLRAVIPRSVDAPRPSLVS